MLLVCAVQERKELIALSRTFKLYVCTLRIMYGCESKIFYTKNNFASVLFYLGVFAMMDFLTFMKDWLL